MLEKVIENWTSKLDYIRASRGSPMPEIIFKISIPLKKHPLQNHPVPPTSLFPYLEFSRQKFQNKEKWLNLRYVNGIETKDHGFLYLFLVTGQHLSVPPSTGHLNNLTYSGGNKRFPIRLQCQLEKTSPQHLLDFLGPDWDYIHDSSLLVSDLI
ncbi:hypothetical protein TNCV_786681 [Trichonephila clavipes]|nr:hypothetical protein TNCV_786681 [Trichonephila clavipes]